MSMRTDSGICRYCGAVLLVEALRRLEGQEGPDAYVCPDCDDAMGGEEAQGNP